MEETNIEELRLYSDVVLGRISNNVVSFRKEKGFSQLKLASEIGVSTSFLGSAELITNKKYHFNIRHIAMISKVLNINIEEFFKDTQ
jgi:putative transcriptional regulator